MALATGAPLALAQTPGQAQAQAAKRVVGAAASATQLTLYGDEDGKVVLRQVAVSSVTFPLPVEREVGDMVLVRLQGQNVWLAASEVAVRREAPVGCVRRRSATQPTMVAGSQGASRECR
jgi:hypothetical protein